MNEEIKKKIAEAQSAEEIKKLVGEKAVREGAAMVTFFALGYLIICLALGSIFGAGIGWLLLGVGLFVLGFSFKSMMRKTAKAYTERDNAKVDIGDTESSH